MTVTTSMAVLIGSDKVVGLAFWSSVILVFTVLEVLGHVPSTRLPSLEGLVRRYFSHPAWRAFTIAVWLYVGYHLLSH